MVFFLAPMINSRQYVGLSVTPALYVSLSPKKPAARKLLGVAMPPLARCALGSRQGLRRSACREIRPCHHRESPRSSLGKCHSSPSEKAAWRAGRFRRHGKSRPGSGWCGRMCRFRSHFYLVLHPRLRCHTLTKKGSIGDLPNGLDEGVSPIVEVKEESVSKPRTSRTRPSAST